MTSLYRWSRNENNMMQTWTMLKREYLARVMRRRFVIGTLIAPLLWIGPFLLPILLINVRNSERAVTVLDQSGDPELFPIIQRNLANNNSAGTKFRLTQQQVPKEGDIEQVRASLKDEITQHADRAYLVLRSNILDGQNPQYYANNVTD